MAKEYAKIYGLADPETGQVLYIGKANNPQDRLKQHLRDCRRRKTPLYSWINKLLQDGKCPQMVVIASAISENWQALEVQLIAQYRSDGRMLNLADGGDQPKTSPLINSANGKRLNARIAADPMLKRVRDLKRAMSRFLRDCNDGNVSEKFAAKIKEKLRIAGHKNPKLFGEYRYL